MRIVKVVPAYVCLTRFLRQIMLRSANDMKLGSLSVEGTNGCNSKKLTKGLEELFSHHRLWLQGEKLLRKLVKAIEPIFLQRRRFGMFLLSRHQCSNDQSGENKSHKRNDI